MFISGHFYVLDMRKTGKYISCVAIGKLEGEVRKASHPSTVSNNRDHPTRSLYYCLFASHIFVCCSSRTSRSWWNGLSTQRQLRGCKNIPTFLQWTAPTHVLFVKATWHHLRILVTATLRDWKTRAASSESFTPEVITEPECRSGLRKEFTIFAEAGAGPGVRFLNVKRTRSWSRSKNFSFFRSRIIYFIKFQLSLNG